MQWGRCDTELVLPIGLCCQLLAASLGVMTGPCHTLPELYALMLLSVKQNQRKHYAGHQRDLQIY